MATGDVTTFDEGILNLVSAGWASGDTIKFALLDNTTAPTASDSTPQLGDYTEVGTGGNYVAGGVTLGTISSLFSQSGGTVTFDSATNPSWTADAGNDTDIYWGLIYNDSQAGDPAIAFVELGGPINMSVSDFTATWNASGIFTIQPV